MTIKRLTKGDIPQSLGAFKPVGHVLLGFHDGPPARDATQALRGAGFGQEDILEFSCEELCQRMEHMLDHASEFAGFGYEVVLMRRYRQLCGDGCRWLLVYAPHDDETQRVSEVAQRLGAVSAVKYHRLAEEDLV